MGEWLRARLDGRRRRSRFRPGSRQGCPRPDLSEFFAFRAFDWSAPARGQVRWEQDLQHFRGAASYFGCKLRWYLSAWSQTRHVRFSTTPLGQDAYDKPK